VNGPVSPRRDILRDWTRTANLASTYRHQGRLKKAEEQFVQVIEMEKRVLGQEHPDTLTSMNNLALVYNDQRRWTEAEKLYEQVVETAKRLLYHEHPSTLISMGNLAMAFYIGDGLSFRPFSFFCSHQSFCLLLSEGTMGSRWELRHLAGSPGGGGVVRLCHTLIRVNTV